MINAIFDFIFRRKSRKRSKTMDFSIITEKTKNQIDKIWNNIDKMSGYGITILCLNTEEDVLAIALAHSSDFTIKRFICCLELNSKFNAIRLINKYKIMTNEEDGYRMKSHIIHLHKERFRKARLI